MQCLVKVISLWKPSALRWSSNWPVSTNIHLNKATSLRPWKMERHRKAKKAKKASTGILKKRVPPSPVTADIIVIVVKKVSLGIFFFLLKLHCMFHSSGEWRSISLDLKTVFSVNTKKYMNWHDNLGKGQAFVGPSTGSPDLQQSTGTGSQII